MADGEHVVKTQDLCPQHPAKWDSSATLANFATDAGDVVARVAQLWWGSDQEFLAINSTITSADVFRPVKVAKKAEGAEAWRPQ